MGDSEKSETQDAEGPDSVTQSSQPTTTVPLTPLIPAQHRHAVKRASLKAGRGNEAPRTTARHAASAIRVRHSAPGQTLRASPNELRVSKSAPDLRAPVLAAIKGLQDGSLQVDVRTRSKIANAARKVLEAREQRRKAKQDVLQGTNQGSKRTAFPLTPPNSESRHTVASLENAVDRGTITQDTAVTEGKASEGNAQHLEVSAASAASFPFIVTTGMPKYAEGHKAGGTSSGGSLSGVRSGMPLFSASALHGAEKQALGSDSQPDLEHIQERGDP